MTKTLKVLIGLAGVLFLAFLAVGSTRASEEPQIIHVTLKDNRIDLSQSVVAPGKAVTFVVMNSSSLPHQFVVEPYASAGSAHTGEEPMIAPGTSWTIQQTLAAGVYRVACENPDHVERGMATALSAQALPQSPFPVRMDFIIPILALVLGTAYLIGDSLGLRLIRE